MRIGIIGIGDMGFPIAKNLQDAGYFVYAYDLSEERRSQFESIGGMVCESIEQLVSNSNVVMTSLPSSEIFVRVAEQLQELMLEGQCLIELGTTVIHEFQAVAQKLVKRGVKVLDAPLSGGPTGAENKNLQVFVGGEREVFEELRPIFEAFGGKEKLYYCGPNGMGQAAKGVNQLSIGLINAVAIEILAFAQREKLDYSLVEKMFSDKFPPVGKMLSAIQDGKHPTVKYRELPYYIDQANTVGYELPITERVYERMSKGEFIAFDDHRKAPSYYYELTK